MAKKSIWLSGLQLTNWFTMNETETLPRNRRMEDLEEKFDAPKRVRETVLAKTKTHLINVIKKATLEKGSAKVCIFSHTAPDPDAIASFMSLKWLLERHFENVEVDCYYDGCVSHPQNLRMVNLLDPDLKVIEDSLDPQIYDLRISVDTVPLHACCPKNTNFDLVIDHHKEIPNGGFKGLFLNLKAGSCCSTIYQLIKEFGLAFEEDNDRDSKVVTALLVGIITDTDYQTSDDTTEFEHSAYAELFEFRNPAALKQICRFKQPREWVQARASTAEKAHDRIKDGVLVHGIGLISASNRDLIAAVADEMLSWESVETAVCFGIIDGNRVEGSIRSSNAALNVPILCKELGDQYGGGGGKLGKGAYHFDLGSLSLDQDSEDSCKEKLWECINDRELKRLHRLIKK